MVDNNLISKTRFSLSQRYAYLGLSDCEIQDLIQEEYDKNKIKYENGFYTISKLNRDITLRLKTIAISKFQSNHDLLFISGCIDNFLSYNEKLPMLNKIQLLSSMFYELDVNYSSQFCLELYDKCDSLVRLIEKFVIKNKKDIETKGIGYFTANNFFVTLISIYCEKNTLSYFIGNDEITEKDVLVDINLEEDGDCNLINLYFNDVYRYRTLTPYEEKILIIKAQNSDKKARDLFLKCNLRLVFGYAKKYMGRGVDFLDLVQEGNIGLIRALEKFDANKGFKFSNYAISWIELSIRRYVHSNAKNIRTSDQMNEDYYKYLEIVKTFHRKYGTAPDISDIACVMGKSVSSIKTMLDAQTNTVSLNKVLYDDYSRLELIDALKGANSNLEKGIIDNEIVNVTNEMLDDAVNKGYINKRSKDILCLRFGIGVDRCHTLEEIGKNYNLTRERIRQIERSSLAMLREYEENCGYKGAYYLDNPDECIKYAINNKRLIKK